MDINHILQILASKIGQLEVELAVEKAKSNTLAEQLAAAREKQEQP